MSDTPHPGKIIFEDEDRGTRDEKDASAVPEDVAFAHVDGQSVPVVRVVMSRREEMITIRSYGTDGRLLASTVGQGSPN